MRPILLFLCALMCSLAAWSQPTTFTFTGQIQTYTVPSCVTQLQYTIKGARGGGAAKAMTNTAVFLKEQGRIQEIKPDYSAFVTDAYVKKAMQ